MQMPRVLETSAEWLHDDVADPTTYTEVLNAAELEELDRALHVAKAKSTDMLQLGKDDFPLQGLGERLRRIENDLINGRGFVVIRGLPRARYDNDDMCLLYWGLGAHLGKPWAQNKHGHVLGDVTDQQKRVNDPNTRGNELGSVPLPYHSDGADLVGLMCLQTSATGGVSTVCNALAIHNDMARETPELTAELYAPQPYDFRGEQTDGGKAYYSMPVFTEWNNRLFIRYIRPYILASQRHADAPRITPRAEEAMQRMDAMTRDRKYEVFMDFEPGDIQFVNNYHVLHARTGYTDDPATGRVRHLKRLWLETEVLKDRPPHFANTSRNDWDQRRSISRLDRKPVSAPETP